jgi:hypothetical protein
MSIQASLTITVDQALAVVAHHLKVDADAVEIDYGDEDETVPKVTIRMDVSEIDKVSKRLTRVVSPAAPTSEIGPN